MGIDLGTIYSCIGIIRKGQVEIIADKADGSRIIPSMVCYKENRWMYGNSAKSNMIEFADSTMFESKRLIGLKFNNKQVKEDIKDWQVKMIEDKTSKKTTICYKSWE